MYLSYSYRVFSLVPNKVIQCTCTCRTIILSASVINLQFLMSYVESCVNSFTGTLYYWNSMSKLDDKHHIVSAFLAISLSLSLSLSLSSHHTCICHKVKILQSAFLFILSLQRGLLFCCLPLVPENPNSRPDLIQM